MSTTNPFVSSFPAVAARDRFARLGWLANLRRSSIERFAELGLPTSRNEEWRYTDPRPILRTAFEVAEPGASQVEASAVAPLRLGAAAAAELVFVNGHFVAEHSHLGALPNGVTVSALSQALEERPAEVEAQLGRVAAANRQVFVALNAAFVQDGALIHVPRGVVLEQPIHLLFLSTDGRAPVVCHPRILIVADEASQLAVVERYVGLGASVHLTNAVTEIVLGPSAVLEHVKDQRESETSYHVSAVHVRQERASQLASRFVSVGGALVRNEVQTLLDGEGAGCVLDGLMLGTRQQHIDSQTLIDHAKPHCESHELYKSVLDGSARSVFNGRVVVRPDAQKTNSQQTNRNLLVSERARADTKPQLEIHADDVKCSHGATIGKLDPAAIFYLRSRGLSEDHARTLLTHGFASEVVDRIKIPAVRDALDHLVASWLPRTEANPEIP